MAEKQTEQKVEKNNLFSKFKKNGAEKKPKIDHSALWGKIGFTLGIVSIGAWLLPLLGLPVAIAGIVFNILGLRSPKYGWAVAGLTLSIIFLNVTMVYGFYRVLIGILQSFGF